MAHSEYVEERKKAVEQLERDFAYLPDKQQAWKDLLRLTKDKYEYVQWRAANALGSAFPHVTDKQQALKTLYELADDVKERNIRISANHSPGRISIYKAPQNGCTKHAPMLAHWCAAVI